MKKLATALVGLLAVGCARSDSADPAPCRACIEDPTTVFARFGGDPDSVPGPVDAFDYEIGLEVTRRMDSLRNCQTVVVTASATKQVPLQDRGNRSVRFRKRLQPGLIDLIAEKVGSTLLSDSDRELVPEKWFRVELPSLRFLPDRPVYLRLPFRDADELFALTFEAGRGLRLVGVKTRFARIANAEIEEFAVLDAKENERTYQCDNLSLVAREGEKELWHRQIPMEGQPTELRMVGNVLFVTSSAKHSMYVKKDDGNLVYYHKGLLAGRSPWDEIQEVARAHYRKGGKGGERASMGSFIWAAALLGDRRAGPFLVECLEKGDGWVDRHSAIAALEYLNGNSQFWQEVEGGQPSDRSSRKDKAAPRS